MAGVWLLTEAQMARLSPLLSNDTRGVPRVDDRRVISGIVHVLRSGGRWAATNFLAAIHLAAAVCYWL